MSKRLEDIKSKVDRKKVYSIREAIRTLKDTSKCNFDETVDVVFNLAINPRKKSDQIVRSTVVLKGGLGKDRTVAVITTGDMIQEAIDANADFYGADDLIEKIQKGWMDFDILIATPSIMHNVSKLGKILGPKGLMPSLKSGTVTFKIAEAIREIKQGRLEFKSDKYGTVHFVLGKISFTDDILLDNYLLVYNQIQKLRPSSVKGKYIKSIFVSSTMGCGLSVSHTLTKDET